MFEDVKPGDKVIRMLAGTIPMELTVQNVSDTTIDCGWTFDRKTGAEVDEELGWGPPPKMTGSYILEKPSLEKQRSFDTILPTGRA
jgi:hypothetical protein